MGKIEDEKQMKPFTKNMRILTNALNLERTYYMTIENSQKLYYVYSVGQKCKRTVVINFANKAVVRFLATTVNAVSNFLIETNDLCE